MSSDTEGHDPFEVPSGENPLLGRIVGGKFCLRRCIGVGAAGTVYRADQTTLGRTVAVKILRPELAADPRFVRRFGDEALAASRLNHPNVVSVIDYGQTDDGLLYLVMEFLRGLTLTEAIRTESISHERVSDIIQQVLLALEEAHACGVVHADLKADNIMIEHRRGDWDLVKVVDFGIARLAGEGDDDKEKDGTISGTPEYMAPEIIRGEEPTPASDIYAVGILLYELLVGTTPFGGGNAIAILSRHLSEEAEEPALLCPERVIPAYLNDAVMRALSKDPDKRFHTAAEFRSYLRNAPNASAISELFHCESCGTSSESHFKFCPECGHEHNTMPGIDPSSDIDEDEDEDEVLVEVEAPPPRRRAKRPSLALGERSLFPLPLVGRESILEDLCSTLRSNTRETILLLGKKGMGTSRVLCEACEQVAHESDKLIYLTSSDPSGQQSTFYPIRSIIAAILDLPPVSSYEQIRDALSEIGVTPRDLPGIAELFNHQASVLRKLDTHVRRREVFAATLRVLSAAGRHSDATLAFEDIEDYDQPSRDLLHQLVESNRRSPSVQIILVSRDEYTGDWPAARRIGLGPLEVSHIQPLVQHMGEHGHEEIHNAKDLWMRTGGVPGHLNHLLRYLAEGGSIESAPESLADLVAARIDLLPGAAQRVLQGASVFGRFLSEEQLIEALGVSVTRQELEGALNLLSARGMLQRQPGLISFQQNLVSEVAYEATPANVRQSLHDAAGHVLADAGAEPSVLGLHAERSQAPERAATLLMKAGDEAVRTFDDVGATDRYKRALANSRIALLHDDDKQVRLRFAEISVKLADTLRASGESFLARGILSEAYHHCQDAPALHAQLLLAESKILACDGNRGQAIEKCRRAIGLAIPLFSTKIIINAYLELAGLLSAGGDNARAIKELNEAVDLITMGEGVASTMVPANFWHLLMRLTQLYLSNDQPNHAAEIGAHAVHFAQEAGNQTGLARMRSTMATVYELLGDEELADRYRQHAIADMRSLGDRRSTAELLLATTRTTQTIQRIDPNVISEARVLAEEVGWTEGVMQARSSER